MSNIKTFALAGMQRSGTNFLAKALDDCTMSWNVQAEEFEYFPRYAPNFHTSGVMTDYTKSKYLKGVNEWFKRRKDDVLHYGKVCPQYTYLLNEVAGVDRKAFLIRHPHDYIISMVNHWNDRATNGRDKVIMIDYMEILLPYILHHSKQGMKVFKYEEYTSDIKHVSNIVDFVGIKDATLANVDMRTKINEYVKQYQPTKYNLLSEVFNPTMLQYVYQAFDEWAEHFYGVSISERERQKEAIINTKNN